MWQLNNKNILQFNKIGRWWNKNNEIDIVAIDEDTNTIIFSECKYTTKPMDVDVFYELLQKKDIVQWRNETRNEKFLLFSINGYTQQLMELSTTRDDLILFNKC